MNRIRNFNFSNPLQGRKWLRLLRPDPVSGIRILPNLDLPRRALGFTFRSNALGLRGPQAVAAPNVLLGTSFAMGFAVDNGVNWYERCLEASAWLNLGLPVGAREIEALFNAIHRGPARLALFLYHPNLWMQTRVFERIRSRGEGIIAGMGWQTDLLPCLRLAARKLRWRGDALRKGELLCFRLAGRTYEMDTLYSAVDLAANPQVAALVTEALERILAKFERVVVIRTRVKQEFVPEPLRNDLLRHTLANYDANWHHFRQQLGGHGHIAFHDTADFSLADYFPRDNHWSPQGNAKFAALVQRILSDEKKENA